MYVHDMESESAIYCTIHIVKVPSSLLSTCMVIIAQLCSYHEYGRFFTDNHNLKYFELLVRYVTRKLILVKAPRGPIKNGYLGCSYTASNYKTKVSQNVCVIKRLCTKCSCHTMKAVIKRQTSQKVDVIKRQMCQNITKLNIYHYETTRII